MLFHIVVGLLIFGENSRGMSAAIADNDTEGYCSTYNGKVCRSQIATRQVWYSLKDVTGGWNNEIITTNLWDEMISELPELCRNAAEV